MKHTEGPWQVIQKEHTSGWGMCVGTDERILARMAGQGQKKLKQANADLMAAAPDMYDALVKLSQLGGGNSEGNRIAQAALAKIGSEELGGVTD